MSVLLGVELASLQETEGALAIREWAVSAGASPEGADHLVLCLRDVFLKAQPQPTLKYRRGQFSYAQNCRHLWYRRAAKILGWGQRSNIPADIAAIIKRRWPDTVSNGAEASNRRVSAPTVGAGSGPLEYVGDRALSRFRGAESIRPPSPGSTFESTDSNRGTHGGGETSTAASATGADACRPGADDGGDGLRQKQGDHDKSGSGKRKREGSPSGGVGQGAGWKDEHSGTSM